MSIFILTIKNRTSAFGETETSERAEIARLLHVAAQKIGQGADPEDLKDGNGTVVGDYVFCGDTHAGAINTNKQHAARYR